MLRIEVTEEGQGALPAIDVVAPAVIGSAAEAAIRLPAEVAEAAHVQLDGMRWAAIAAAGVIEHAVDATVVGHRTPDAGRDAADAPAARTCRAGDGGPIGAGVTFVIGRYRVRVAPSPAEAVASPVQRTESLARELARSWLGADAAACLVLEHGPVPGARRALPPPIGTLVIGRGDDATWVILDEDLSRTHAEIVRGWDGTTIRDLDSKNGTKVDGLAVTARATLRDGCRIELGKVVLRFIDPAERHLRGEVTAALARSAGRTVIAAEPSIAVGPRPPAPATLDASRAAIPWMAVAAAAVAALALAGTVWVLST